MYMSGVSSYSQHLIKYLHVKGGIDNRMWQNKEKWLTYFIWEFVIIMMKEEKKQASNQELM